MRGNSPRYFAHSQAVLRQNPSPFQLPHIIKPGEMWHGEVSQSQMKQLFAEHEGKLVYIAVAHATSKREPHFRLRSDDFEDGEKQEIVGD